MIVPLLLILTAVQFFVEGQDNPADLEYSGYVFTHHKLPFKNRDYAREWLGYNTALIQSPLLAAGKPVKPGHPVALPTIAPFVARWSNLGDTHVNDENWWNFEKRIDTKVWWPSK
ncbi:hypothetical protein PRIPAC_77862 [Pristionchus pacificus]|uniref:Uncharacterized protein n=1 Tax=Pristionchus pacificus TaxID=54126 RepID=A0A2A6CBF9_PRIPA|nr:hypothetical protein PRIPAC_77862 [Pristionchus pacificus]|eukprot:PDM75469.1 hypothetical protein PRIPAC_42646 [Pristionchus pacificus]